MGERQSELACCDMANVIAFIYVSLSGGLTALWGNSGFVTEEGPVTLPWLIPACAMRAL